MSKPDPIAEHIEKIRVSGQGPATPLILYGANVQLARDLGVPIFIDGDTGEIVRTPSDE